MIKEAYCSFEVAKLLKEKGFEGSCDMSYNNKGNMLCNLLIGYDEEAPIIVSNQTILPYKAPTQQMAMRFLRENYGINLKAEEKCFCETSHDGMRVKKVYYHWCPEIQLLHNTKIHEGLVPINSRMEINADSYEDAIDKGIEWILENLV